MNDAVQALIEDVRRFEYGGGSDEAVLEAVKLFEAFVLDLNRDLQLQKGGRNAEGNRISPAYTPFTVSLKKKKGQPSNRVTLRDTGAFHRSFYIEYDLDEFTIYADDSKVVKLVTKYGPEILGLDDDSVQLLIEQIRDDLILIVKNQIFK